MSKAIVVGICLTFVLTTLALRPAVAQDEQPATPAAEAEAGADDAAQPQPQPANGAKALTATIIGVRGRTTVVRNSEDDEWQIAKVGMIVEQGAEFRTGPRGKLQIKILPDQVVTIDRLTEIKLLEALQTGEKKVSTKVGMPRGRVLYQVADPTVEHNATLSSPSATHAVRGTQGVGMSEDTLGPPMAFAMNNQLSTMVNWAGLAVELDSEGNIITMDGNFNSLARFLYVNSNADHSGIALSLQDIEALLISMYQRPFANREQFAADLGASQHLREIRQMFGTLLGSGIPSSADTLATMAVLTSNSDVDFRFHNGVDLATFLGVAVGTKKKDGGGQAGPDLPRGGTEWIAFQKQANRPSGAVTLEAFYFSGPATDVTFELKVGGVVIGTQTVNVGPGNLSDSAGFVVP